MKKARLPVSFEQMDQKDVKVFMPPDAKVWKARRDAFWKAQVSGWPKEIARSVPKCGENEALIQVISQAWYQSSVLAATRYEDASVEGLFALGVVVASERP